MTESARRPRNEVVEPRQRVTSPAVSNLIAELASGNGAVRQRARGLLVEIGGPAVGPLTGALEDPIGQVRWEAAKALGEIGDAALPSAPALVRTLEDPGETFAGWRPRPSSSWVGQGWTRCWKRWRTGLRRVGCGRERTTCCMLSKATIWMRSSRRCWGRWKALSPRWWRPTRRFSLSRCCDEIEAASTGEPPVAYGWRRERRSPPGLRGPSHRRCPGRSCRSPACRGPAS